VMWNCRGSMGGTGASRWCGWIGRGDRSAAAASSVRCQLNSFLINSQHTIETTRHAHNGLDNAQDALQPLPDIRILRLHRLFLPQHDLQVMVRLLALQVPYPLIEPVNLVLSPLPNSALGLAVVCALPGELFGGEVGDTTRIGPSPALFVGLAVARAIVSRCPFGCICLARRRHADGAWVMDASDSVRVRRIPPTSHEHALQASMCFEFSALGPGGNSADKRRRSRLRGYTSDDALRTCTTRA
jgi:hypothetical protein